jgi:hypothetical protein
MASSTLTALGAKLTDATRRSFSIGYKQVPNQGRSIFDVQMTGNKVEVFNSAIMDQFAASTGDGENYASFDPTLGDEMTLTQSKVTASFEVTEDANQYDQYNVLSAMEGGEGLGSATAKRIELDLQQLISNGGSANYTDKDGNVVSCLAADGLSLFNNSHTVNGSATTYDNLDATAFGQTGLETLENLFRNFLNHDGQVIDRAPTAIFSTTKPALVNLIREYNKSMGHVEDAFNGTNEYMHKYNHIPLHYLDKTSVGAVDAAKDDYWGLVMAKNKNLKLRVSQNPTIHPAQLVQRNRNVLFQASAKYAYGVEDPNCIALSAA